ncbi:MAG: four helix bundle protein [Salibacteraceae bacterium]
MKVYSFEKLDVWNKAADFVCELYKVTRKFPSEEKYGLTSQLRRAAVSIASNIAEGSSRKSKKDQSRFYVIAYSSTIEVINQLIIAKRLEYLQQEEYENLRKQMEEITGLIGGLHKSLNTKP